MKDARGSRILISRPDGVLESELTANVTEAFPGAKVETIEGLEDTLAAVTTFPPHVLILDLVGNVEDAFILLQSLPRERRAYPILIAMAEARAASAPVLMEKGVDDILFKPLESLVLQAHLASLLSGNYTSSYSFHGASDGIGTLKFDLGVEVLSLDEYLLRFESRFSMHKGANITAQLGQLKLLCTVVGVDPIETGGFAINGQINEIKGGDRATLRKLILELIGKRTSEVEGILFDDQE